MKSLRPAALLVGFLVFDVLSICQGNRKLIYVLSGNSDLGRQGPYGGGPLRLGSISGDSYTSPSGVIEPFGGPRYRLPNGLPGGTRSTLNAEANYGSRDTGRIRGIARITRRRTILILIRKRRPSSLYGSDKGEDRERWSRPSTEDSWGDYYRRQQLRAKHALLRAILKRILLSAARQRTARGEGGDVDDQWNRSEGGQQFPVGGSVGSSHTTEARGRPWASDGYGFGGGRLVIVVRRRNVGDGGSGGSSSDHQNTGNVRRGLLGEIIKRLMSRMPDRAGEADGYSSRSGNGGTVYGIFGRIRGGGTEGSGSQYSEISSPGSSGFTDARRSVGSGYRFLSRHLPWHGNGARFAQYPSHFAYGSGGGLFGGMQGGGLPSRQEVSDSYTGWTPWLHLQRMHFGYPERVENGGFGGWYGSRFKHILHSGLSGDPRSWYSGGFGGDYDRGFGTPFNGRENAYSSVGDHAVAARSTNTFEDSSPFSIGSRIGTTV